MKPIDIFITCFLRQFYTQKTLEYLEQRTKYPYRLFMINNGGNDEVIDEAIKQNKVFLALKPSSNIGIHAAWNLSLAMVESEYFVTSDNDIYVPDLRNKSDDLNPVLDSTLTDRPCWLERLVKLMDERPNYGAIALQPHVFIGLDKSKHLDDGTLLHTPMVGAVMRLMRTEAVRKAGGWERVIRTSRNHEESTICTRLKSVGYNVAYASKLYAYHPFGKNWGYPETLDPHEHGHRRPGTEIWPPPEAYDKIELYNENTWMLK